MSKTIITLIGVFLCTSLIQAQNSDQPADTLELGTVLVTASKLPTSLRETTRSAIVIDQKTIEQNVGKDLSQLLNEYSGITVNGAFSNPGKDKAIYIQGAPLKYTLILVDGQPVNDPSGNGGIIDLRAIPLANVERIELVKGSMSTLYGSDAIAGVINIISRKPAKDQVSANGILSYGSLNSYTASLGVSGSVDKLGYSLNYVRDGSDGISDAEQPDTVSTSFDDDSFTRDAFSGKIDIKPLEGFTITPFLDYSSFEGGYDDGSFDDGDNTYNIDLLNTGATLNYRKETLKLSVAYSFTRTDRAFESSFGVFEGKGRLHNIDVFASEKLFPNIHFLLGLNVQNLGLDNGNDGVENPSADITSPYANLMIRDWKNLNIDAGLRINRHSEYGTNLTYSLGANYSVTNELQLTSSLSTGFRAPTLNELYGPFGGNTELEPERSLSFDAGINATLLENRFRLSSLFFSRKIEDLIVSTPAFLLINSGDEVTRGIEINTQLILNHAFRFTGYYNYTYFDETAYRRPDHTFGIGTTFTPINEWTITLQNDYIGGRKDIRFNPDFTTSDVVLEAYLITNLYAEYRIQDSSIALFTDIKNLFNVDYTEVYGFSTLGFNAKAGVRFQL